jgi:glycosidase
MTLNEFEAFLSGHEAYFPPEFSRPAFLDNHDMSRFYYIAGEDEKKLKLAALLLYTLSGPPIVYNGTESGVSQERPMQQGSRYIFEEARMPMNWDQQNAELLAYFKQLNKLRHSYPVLIYGKRATLHLDSDNGTLAYTRTDTNTTVLVVINTSHFAQTITIPVKDFPPEAGDLLNSQPVTILPGLITIKLPAQSGVFIA